ncbi:MAG: hypothetical protein FJ009_07445 [Chloroflexi bacterium]|nr:hypothetical protein [Chloroflexota bacterium]
MNATTTPGILSQGSIEERLKLLEARVTQLEQRISKRDDFQSGGGGKNIGSGTSIDHQPPLFEIVKVDTRVTESNTTWWKFAWKLVLKSLSEVPLQLSAKVEFLDAEGFVVDDDSKLVLMQPNREETFTDYKLVNAAVAGNIRSISAKVALTR